MTLTGSLALPHSAANVPTARHCLAGVLADADVVPACVDDAVLVLSELVGNALRHAQPRSADGIAIEWRLTPTRVHLAVTDGGGTTWPTVGDAGPAASSGRGLHIVALLALKWGVRTETDGGHTVWAVLSAPRQSRVRARAPRELRERPPHGQARLRDGGQQLVR